MAAGPVDSQTWIISFPSVLSFLRQLETIHSFITNHMRQIKIKIGSRSCLAQGNQSVSSISTLHNPRNFYNPRTQKKYKAEVNIFHNFAECNVPSTIILIKKDLCSQIISFMTRKVSGLDWPCSRSCLLLYCYIASTIVIMALLL